MASEVIEIKTIFIVKCPLCHVKYDRDKEEKHLQTVKHIRKTCELAGTSPKNVDCKQHPKYLECKCGNKKVCSKFLFRHCRSRYHLKRCPEDQEWISEYMTLPSGRPNKEISELIREKTKVKFET